MTGRDRPRSKAYHLDSPLPKARGFGTNKFFSFYCTNRIIFFFFFFLLHELNHFFFFFFLLHELNRKYFFLAVLYSLNPNQGV